MSALRKLDIWAQERRRHARVAVTIDGRLMLEDKLEFPCQVVDMSPGGLRLKSPARARVTEKVVAYLDHFGRVEGLVVRLTADGFALKLNLPPVKRDRVADLLTWLANRGDSGAMEDRRHQRIVPRMRETTLQWPTSPIVPSEVIDISVSGAGIATSRKPAIGTRVTVGHTPGKVVRHFDNGIAIEFLRLVPTETFDEDIIL